MSFVKWTRESIHQLLDLLRENQHLWLTSHSDYRNTYKRSASMAFIAMELGVEKDDVQNKIHNLRCQFRNERRREDSRKNVDSTAIYKSKWEYYDKVQFLYEGNDYDKKNFSIIQQITPTNNFILDNTPSPSKIRVKREILNGSNFKHTLKCIPEYQSPKKSRLSFNSTPSPIPRPLTESQNDSTASNAGSEEETANIDEVLYNAPIIDNSSNGNQFPENLDHHDVFGKFVASELRILNDAPSTFFKTKKKILRALTEAWDELDKISGSSQIQHDSETSTYVKIEHDF